MIKHDHEPHQWSFLTNHSYVLLCLARDSSLRIRDIAEEVGITERAVLRIIADLEESGYVDRLRDGRCNTYRVHSTSHLRHPIEKHRRIYDLVSLINGRSTSGGERTGDGEHVSEVSRHDVARS